MNFQEKWLANACSAMNHDRRFIAPFSNAGIAQGLKGLGLIVLGGLGNIPGAVVGGLLIGLAEAFVFAEYSGYQEAIAFALLFIMLLVRPQGILGRSVIQKV